MNNLLVTISLALLILLSCTIIDKSSAASCIESETSCTCLTSKKLFEIACIVPNKKLNLNEIVNELSKFKQNLDSVKFEMSDIRQVRNVSFAGLRIDSISLKFNRIEQISQDVLDSLAALRDISFKYNFLKDSFQLRSTRLESLSLGWNLFTMLERKMFAKITSLKSLDLAHNKISRVESDTFADLTSLRTLSIFNNQIKDIADDEFRFPYSLDELNIGLNYIDQINPVYFNGSSNISIFWINYNHFKSLKNGSFEQFTNLKALNMSFQMITSFSRSGLKGLSKIDSFNVSSNLIEFIHNDTFLDSPYIRILDFSSNMIKDGCSFVRNLSYLSISYLSLSDNQIADMGSFCFKSQIKLTELYLDFNKLTKLKENAFNGLESSLQYLSIRRNKIQVIKKHNFARMSSIKELNLSFNQISSIEKGSFNLMNNLTILSLDNNCLYSLDSNVWKGLASLNYLRLDKNVLSRVNFTNTTKIKYLDLSDNFLNWFSMDQLNIESLEALSLSNNPYLKVFESNRNVTSLKRIKLSYNDIQDARLQTFSSLNYIDLSYSSPYIITSILNSIPQNPTQWIELLDLSYCSEVDMSTLLNKNLSSYLQNKVKQVKLRWANLTDINDLRRFSGVVSLDISEIKWSNITFTLSTVFVKGVYPRIQILYAEDIGFSSIDALNLQVPTNLIELYLGWNQFEYVSSSHFKSNPKLQVLCLNDNGLKYIENGTLLSLINLVYLDVSNNFLQHIEPFYNLLVYLDTRNNLLTEIFNSELHKVNRLDFSDNLLTEFPTIRSSSVDYLNMSVNKILKLKNDTFLFFFNLTKLYLNLNEIETIEPNTFKKLHFLQELDLSGNNISQFDELVFSGLINLLYLNISYNKLEFIQDDLLNDLVAVQSLDISYNQLKFIEDWSFVDFYSLSYLCVKENSDLDELTNDTFRGLKDSIALIEIDKSLVNKSENFIILFDAFKEKPSDRKLQLDSRPEFFYSLDIVYTDLDREYTDTECENIIKFVRHNKKLNLYTDSLVVKFLNDCQSYVDSLFDENWLKHLE